MIIRKPALVLTAAIVISGCGSSATSTAHNPPSSSQAIASSQAIPEPSPVDSTTAGIVCADLNALAFAGNSSDPISTVADANRITVNQVIYAINHRCPKLKSLES